MTAIYYEIWINLFHLLIEKHEKILLFAINNIEHVFVLIPCKSINETAKSFTCRFCCEPKQILSLGNENHNFNIRLLRILNN